MNANLKLAAAAIAALSLIVNGSAISLASVNDTPQVAAYWNENAGNELLTRVGALRAASDVPDTNLLKPAVRLSGAQQLIAIYGPSIVPEADLYWNEPAGSQPATRLSGAQQLIAIGGPGNVPEADLFWNEPAGPANIAIDATVANQYWSELGKRLNDAQLLAAVEGANSAAVAQSRGATEPDAYYFEHVERGSAVS